MKKNVLIFISIIISTLLPLGKAYSQTATDWFITVWKSDNPSRRAGNTNTSIAFPGVGTNYTLKWENVANPAQNGTVTVPSSSAWTPYKLNVPAIGTYRIYAHKGSGSFTGFNHNNFWGCDPEKLLSVQQWGTTVWATNGLYYGFYLCPNMDVTATDRPTLTVATDLSNMFNGCKSLTNSNGSIGTWLTANVKNMSSMFAGATVFNQNIGGWNTANVIDMGTMFYQATSFNQNIGGWNTANVIGMNSMFAGATAFNKPIGGWNTAKVTGMRSMFAGATAFNQPIGGWNTANVTNMGTMFNNATAFNQPIGGWNIQAVVYMAGMFAGATAFNQNIGGWNTANVTNMASMFSGATAFNQNISGWNTAKVTDMRGMFSGATSFNQPLNTWNIAKVTNMRGMFSGATSFNQPLNTWNVSQVTDMSSMFSGATAFDYDLSEWNIALLQNAEAMFLNTGISCQNYSVTLVSWAGKSNTAQAVNFTNQNTPYNPHAEAALRILTSPTTSGGKGWLSTIYPSVACGGADNTGRFITVWSTDIADTDIELNILGSGYFIDYVELDALGNEIGPTTTITATGNHFQFSPGGAGLWRVKAYDSATGHITGLSTGGLSASSVAQLIRVEQWGNTAWTSLSKAFEGCLFLDITATDVPNLSNVTDLSYMFYWCGRLKYNPTINNWDVSKITDMRFMFNNASLFDQPLNEWNTSSVTNMSALFFYTSFNRSLNKWNTANVTNMDAMFARAAGFNQYLGDWSLQSLTGAPNMFDHSGIDCQNYSATLISWANNPSTAIGVDFTNQINTEYSYHAQAAYDKLGAATASGGYGWSTDGNLPVACGGADNTGRFITVWNTSDGAIRVNILGTSGYKIDYVQLDAFGNETGPTTTVTATGNHFQFSPGVGTWRLKAYNSGTGVITGLGITPSTGDMTKLLRVEQWGNTVWSSLNRAFAGCVNMDITAMDIPNLSGVTSLSNMFQSCFSLIYNPSISLWDISTVTDISGMFSWASSFDQHLKWNTSNVVNMSNVFSAALAFNRPLNWDTSRATDMNNMFSGALAFNQPLNWNTSSVTNMNGMFSGANAFNQPLNWDTGNVTDMAVMFNGTKVFDQPLSWNTGNVTTMSNMFSHTERFNQDISGWDVRKLEDASWMFRDAQAFDQNLGSWQIDKLNFARDMFWTTSMSCTNYTNTLIGWANYANTPENVNFGFQTGSVYNHAGNIARNKLMATVANGGKNWEIHGDTYDPFCGDFPKLWIGTTSNDWSTASNWLYNTIPAATDSMEFATAANNGGASAINDLHISGNQTVAGFANATDKKLVVPPATSFTVTGKLIGSEVMAKADKIEVRADAVNPNGALILANPVNDVYGTVYLTVKSGKLSSPQQYTDNVPGSPTFGEQQSVNYTWQYFGVPVEQVKANNTFYGAYLREYSEPQNAPDNFYGKWITLHNSSILRAFKGYEISHEGADNSNPIYWIQGKFLHGDRTLTLTRKAAAVAGATGDNVHYGLGQNIFGNSYTAAIKISDIVFPAELERAVYLYSTGSLAQWGGHTAPTSAVGSLSAGNFLAIPQNSSFIWEDQIPSMQGFMLKFTDVASVYNAPDVTINIPYTGVKPNTKPQMAPAYSGASGSSESGSSGNNGELSYMQVTLGSRTTTDNLWLFEQEGTSERFDNGWDGRKYFGTPASFIYVKSPDGELQVSTNSTLDGTLITHYANRDTAYTLTLTRHNMPSESNPLYLIDLVERTYTALTSDTTRYNFTVDSHNVAVKRFMLTSRKPGGEVIGGSSDAELLDLYFTPDGEVVLNNFTKEEGTATLYDVSGRVAGRYSAPVGTTRISLRHLPAGVYFATAEASTQRKTEKGVISIGQ